MSENAETQKPRIFISYSHQDADWTRALVEELARRQFRVWFDEYTMHYMLEFFSAIVPPDAIWPTPDRLGQGVTDSDIYIIVMTEDSLRSPWVRGELFVALQTRKIIIPILRYDPGPGDWPPPFDRLHSYQSIDATDKRGGSIQEIARTIAQITTIISAPPMWEPD